METKLDSLFHKFHSDETNIIRSGKIKRRLFGNTNSKVKNVLFVLWFCFVRQKKQREKFIKNQFCLITVCYSEKYSGQHIRHCQARMRTVAAVMSLNKSNSAPQ